MRAPDMEASKKRDATVGTHEKQSPKGENVTRSNGRSRPFGKKSDGSNALTGSLRITPAQKFEEGLSEKRRSCPAGKAFYRCANGFTGCCSIDPCLPGGSCPDSRNHRTNTKEIQSTTQVQTVTSSTSKTSDASRTSPTQTLKTPEHSSGSQKTSTQITASSLKSSVTSKPTSTATSSSTTPGGSPPACPDDSGSLYTDTSKTKYTVHCNSDNTYATNETIKVKVGGYAECFSACSHSDECAGFTFMGSQSGTCFLKAQMPGNSYVMKSDNNYVSCSKVNATASAPGATDSPSPSSSSNNHIIVIVGGVLGGVAFIVLLLVLVAFLAKRKRRKLEERRATITHNIQGPFESDQLHYNAGHQRQGSSSHDVFTPFGGYYRGSELDDPVIMNKWQGGTPPGMRAEGETELLPLIYQPAMPQQTEHLAMPDAAAFRPNSRDSGSRSPRFHEHLDDDPYQLSSLSMMPPSPANDSPTLGRLRMPPPAAPLADQIKRQQHMAYRTPVPNSKPHDAASRSGTEAESREPYSTRSISPVSPTSNNDPLDRDFAVSPLFSSNKRDKW